MKPAEIAALKTRLARHADVAARHTIARDRLIELLYDNGVSLRQIAAVAGVSYETVRTIGRRRPKPKPELEVDYGPPELLTNIP
jgi:transposase